VYFTSASGNVVDDRTHCATWDLLHQLVGRPEFLYVADCKLASSENLAHIATRGGRFVTVLPKTYKEDGQFRARLREQPDSVRRRHLYDVTNGKQEILARYSVCGEEMISGDGYRLLWFHSTRKAELDNLARNRRLQRALSELTDLQTRLTGPRTRFRERAKVEEAVAGLLEQHAVAPWLKVQIEERNQESYRQASPGRPSKGTQYVKQTRPGYSLSYDLDRTALAQAEHEDGVFPLLTNDRSFDAEQVLRAYKRQPLIEKRFSQLKTDFAVAPVYLKNVTRIQGLLAIYFLVLLTQTLLERELRRAMVRAELASLPLYPEGRPCARPTTQKILELFEPIQRHELRHLASAADDVDGGQILVTALTPVQRKVLQLLGLKPADYGR
jgi:transposase